jgi:hypothetical protein
LPTEFTDGGTAGWQGLDIVFGFYEDTRETGAKKGQKFLKISDPGTNQRGQRRKFGFFKL